MTSDLVAFVAVVAGILRGGDVKSGYISPHQPPYKALGYDRDAATDLTTIPTQAGLGSRRFRGPSSAARPSQSSSWLRFGLHLPPPAELPINCAGCSTMIFSSVDHLPTERY
jgi:hypothetical protein